jgi:DNA-dependent RNA polymerase auxiliary subunit epsilon
MTDEELIRGLDIIVRKQAKHIQRLKKRLLEKKKYEIEFLKMAGACTDYMRNIDTKDAAALAG